MIVPMKKVSLIVLENARREATQKLRKLGVMHLEELHGSGSDLDALQEKFSKADAAFSILAEYKVPKGQYPTYAGGDAGVFSKIEKTIEWNDRKKSCFEQIAFNSAELERFSKWGAFDPAALEQLTENGVYLSLYEIPSDKYAVLPESLKTICVGRDKAQTRFLLVGEKDRSRPEEMPPEAYAMPTPRLSTYAFKKEIIDFKAEIAAIEDHLTDEAIFCPEIAAYRKRLQQDIAFENVCSGMYTEDKSDATNAVPLAWLSGFVPTADVKIVRDAAKAENWALAIDDPAEEDPVPTKLKNNPLVSLIYPLTDFLETVPGYREYDISGWFLLFFCIFFGMIFGDAGYGTILMLIALLGIFGSLVKGKKAPQGFKMLLLLSFANIAWGVATCTWFGVEPQFLPDFLTSHSLLYISNVTAAMSDEANALVGQNLQILCFSLALLQLSIAHLKGIGRNIRSLRLFGELGSLAMLVGMYNVVIFLVVSNSYRSFPLLPQALYLLLGGFVLNFVFANYEGSVIGSIVVSLKNIISVVLGVTNVFSDIMSYIRLWAVGLAGSAISSTVNQMAGPMLGGFIMFAGVLLLVFGHGLNVILNVLSVLVHGVRLNTLEFSSHLGISWSGIAYRPFSETAKK